MGLSSFEMARAAQNPKTSPKLPFICPFLLKLRALGVSNTCMHASFSLGLGTCSVWGSVSENSSVKVSQWRHWGGVEMWNGTPMIQERCAKGSVIDR
jgi:ABC-type amino acid transport system permease subunit